MIDTIKLPNKYIEEIRAEGKRASRIRRETFGYLFGYEEADSVFVAGKSRVPLLLRGDGSLHDTTALILSYPWKTKTNVVFHQPKLMRKNTKIRKILYHSHPSSSFWSYDDIKRSQNLKEIDLLYISGTDNFVAISGGKNIFIDVVDYGVENNGNDISTASTYKISVQLSGASEPYVSQAKLNSIVSCKIPFNLSKKTYNDFHEKIHEELKKITKDLDIDEDMKIRHLEIQRDDGKTICRY